MKNIRSAIIGDRRDLLRLDGWDDVSYYVERMDILRCARCILPEGRPLPLGLLRIPTIAGLRRKGVPFLHDEQRYAERFRLRRAAVGRAQVRAY